MPRTVIACYRPKPGHAGALDALARTHFARLYQLGLVTRRLPILMRAQDGTVLEVFSWKSQAAIDAAHHHPAVLSMWEEYTPVCDYVPVGSLPEAAELFAGFDSAEDLQPVKPPFFNVFNHVQVSDRLSTSGAINPAALDVMAAEGYRVLINLLPDESPHALSDEAELAHARGLAYHYIPVDFKAPRREDYEAFEAALQAAGDQKTYVHCAANMRVSAFVALYGPRHFGWDAARAAAHLSEVWQPDEVWQGFLERM